LPTTIGVGHWMFIQDWNTNLIAFSLCVVEAYRTGAFGHKGLRGRVGAVKARLSYQAMGSAEKAYDRVVSRAVRGERG
jgi:hypothetical protein